MAKTAYGSTRVVLGIAEVLLWIASVIVAIQALIALGDRDSEMMFAPMMGVAFGGVVSACLLRVSRAILDIADCQRAVAAATLPADALPFAADAPAPLSGNRVRDWTPGTDETYGGYRIEARSDHVQVEGRYFDSMKAAKAHIDTLPNRE